MKKGHVALLAWGIVAIGLSAAAAFGVKDGSQYANAYQPIVFGNITTADTLESVKCLPLHKEITYFIKIASRRHAGFTAGDSVQVILAGSADDSTYTNLSGTGDRITYTAAGTWTVTFYGLASYRYTRLEVPNLAAADSLTVSVKAVISPKEAN